MHIPERRKFKRIKKKFLLSFRDLPIDSNRRDSGWDMAHMENLGPEGLLFKVDKTFKLGTLLELKLKLPFVEEPIRCIGKVLRVEPQPSSILVNIAVAFMEMVKGGKEGISKIVNSSKE
jgi:hypothetical protein